jgi:hypothetical protein
MVGFSCSQALLGVELVVDAFVQAWLSRTTSWVDEQVRVDVVGDAGSIGDCLSISLGKWGYGGKEIYRQIGNMYFRLYPNQLGLYAIESANPRKNTSNGQTHETASSSDFNSPLNRAASSIWISHSSYSI